MKNAFKNTTYTQNGALTNKTSLNKVLDLFSMGATATSDVKKKLFSKAFKKDKIKAMKTVMYLRDPRDGQGNRDILQEALSYIQKKDGKKVIDLIEYIPQIGSYKDLTKLYESTENQEIKDKILDLFFDKIMLEEDSLAAKWFPRRTEMFKDFATKYNFKYRDLRKKIVSITQVVEQKMCKKEWETIEYKTVPSLANMKYRQAFLRHDEKRYEQFLRNVLDGKTTMNSSLLYPADLVKNVRSSTKEQIQAMFEQMKNNFKQTDLNILPVIDSSASMEAKVPGSKYTAWQIALGLGIYIANNNPNPKFNKFICDFSDGVRFKILKGTIKKQIKSYKRFCCSTNLIGVFKKLIKLEKTNKIKKEDMPDILLVVSDMEFNYINSGFTKNYDKIKQMYEENDLKMPLIVFWRVDVKIKQQPITTKDWGILINGFSPNILKQITEMNMENIKEITPIKIMEEAINIPKYKFIEEIFQ